MAGRLAAAFAGAERDGLMLAGQVRAVGVLAILVWDVMRCPCDGAALAYEIGMFAVFLCSGLAHLILVWRRRCPGWLTGLFFTFDAAVLGFVMVTPNPFMGFDIDPALFISNAYFVGFYLLLMQACFSYSAPLVLYTGSVICAAWTGVLAYALSLPGSTSEFAFGPLGWVELFEVYHLPGFVYVGEWLLQILVTLVVTAGLSLVVHRARRMALSNARSERARANLARYFAPGIVDLLAEREGGPGLMRRHEAAVLFVDIRDFTPLAETLPPEQVMHLLRRFHSRMEAAIFRHGGMMEKYIGDAMLATFGAPDPGPRDATAALACARDMLAAMQDWNRERAAVGEAPLAIGIGLNYGPVVQGDIGTARSMAFAVIGDTVNTCSRLQGLAGRVGPAVIMADALVARIRAELPAAEAAQRLAGLQDLGERRLKGRARPVGLHGLAAREAGGPPPAAAANAGLAVAPVTAQGRARAAGARDDDQKAG